MLFHAVIYGGFALKKSGSQDRSPIGGFSAGSLGAIVVRVVAGVKAVICAFALASCFARSQVKCAQL